MRSVAAIFIKQSQDVFRNMGVLVQFFVFPGMAFIMTWVLNIQMDGISDTFFISIFASMFVGMTIISATATTIAEDREKKSLRFLLMAGVKSYQYLIGIGGVFILFALVANVFFVIMIPGLLILERLVMLFSLLLGVIASVLIGAIIGMVSKNEQSAISIGSAVGMVLGFGPLLATFSEGIKNCLCFFYSMNFVFDDFRMVNIVVRLIIILVNIFILVLIFAWLYRKRGLNV